jgi:hypothetical protein
MLQKSRSNLLNIVNTTFFLNVLETSPDSLHSLLVILYYFDSFFISCNQMSQTVSHKRQVINTLTFLLTFYSPLDNSIIHLRSSQAVSCMSYFHSEKSSFFLIFSLCCYYSLLILFNSLFSLRYL